MYLHDSSRPLLLEVLCDHNSHLSLILTRVEIVVFRMMPRGIVNFIVLIIFLVEGVDSQKYFPVLLWHSAGW